MIQEDLKKKSQELLNSGRAQVIIGYGKGSGNNVRTVFVRNPENTDILIFDDRCVQNLAVYILKPEIKELGKPAIVAPFSVMRTINQLIYERQIPEDGIILIGVSQNGNITEINDAASLRTYLSGIPLPQAQDTKEKLKQIEKLSQTDRWNYWKEMLSTCIKCYACRSSCPLCYCSRCTVDCNQPQWISAPAHELGNFEWHIMRAMHLAGRCVDCGECARACPIGIPLNLLTQKLTEVITDKFGETIDQNGAPVFPLSTFKSDDKEDFIR